MSASRVADEVTGKVTKVENSQELYAVIPAAGSGRRMNNATPKQHIELGGGSVLRKTINRLLLVESIKKIVVVLDAINIDNQDVLLYSDDSSVDQAQLLRSKIVTCIGGANRAESVKNGLTRLREIAPTGGSVLVHDAARPCVRVSDIHKLIREVGSDSNGGLLAMPVSDTIKLAGRDGRIQQTLNRESLWRAATPQLFDVDKLLSVVNTALVDGVAITDEASAMEHAGYKPMLIECQSDNIKITTATDLVLAKHYLAAQGRES